MTPHAPAPDAAVRTRRALLDRLKRDGPAVAAALADALGVTAMAVRQHLYELQGQKLVTFDTQPRPVGRPAKLWRLTPEADRCFPDAHAELTVNLITAVRQTFGDRGLKKMLACRKTQMIDHYQRHVPRRASLRRRVQTLAALRSAEGYMAQVLDRDGGELLLVENHCPICDAAASCQGLCGIELDVFQELLGERVRVERTEHIQAGARRCAYRIAAR